MAKKEMADKIIAALKNEGVFIPEDKSFDDILKKMEDVGYVNVTWNELPDEHPFSVEATELFEKSVRLGII